MCEFRSSSYNFNIFHSISYIRYSMEQCIPTLTYVCVFRSCHHGSGQPRVMCDIHCFFSKLFSSFTKAQISLAYCGKAILWSSTSCFYFTSRHTLFDSSETWIILAFWRSVFLWTVVAFPQNFINMFSLLSQLTLTYESFKQEKGS